MDEWKADRVKKAFEMATGPELRMRNWRLTAAEVPAIFDGLRQKVHIKRLDLSANLFGPPGLALIAEALANDTHVEVLDISINRGETGVCQLADALQQNRCLSELDLSVNHIDEKGLMYLLAALREATRFSYLSILNIQSNEITPAVKVAIEQLKDARPELTCLTELRGGVVQTKLPGLDGGRTP